MKFKHMSFVFAALITSTTLLHADWQEELETINAEITKLETELSTERRHAFNDEVSAQTDLRFNNKEFVNKVSHFEEDEQHVKSIKDKIEALNQRKKEITQQHPQQHQSET